jgi:aminomethyltransferase
MTTPGTPQSSLPLAPLDQRLGAVTRAIDDVPGVAAHYGSPAAEYEALGGAAGLVDRSWLDRLEMRGEDRRRFLNGQVTCDVKSLEAGRLTYGFFTSRQGKVQADATILALDDRFWVELPAGRGGEIRAHLEKYILVDRVEVEPLTAAVPVAVVGPRGAEVLAAAGLPVPGEDGLHTAGELAGAPLWVARRPLFALPACTLWLDAAAAVRQAEELLARGAAAGLVPVGFEALETRRVERGAPRFGADFGPDHLPQETGLEEQAVSYTKGCYLGQEVVARIHYRGRANRLLRGLVFDLEEPPAAATALLHEDRPAGRVGTAVVSPALGAVVGLAVLHRRAAEAGTVLAVEGGGTAEVRGLPLVG